MARCEHTSYPIIDGQEVERQCLKPAERKLSSMDRYSPDEGYVVELLCEEHAEEEWVRLTTDEALTGITMVIL